MKKGIDYVHLLLCLLGSSLYEIVIRECQASERCIYRQIIHMNLEAPELATPCFFFSFAVESVGANK